MRSGWTPVMRRAAAGAAALLACSLSLPAPAPAASGGSITGTSAATAVAWGVVPAATSVSSVPPCRTTPAVCISFTGTGVGPWYFNVWNTGTVTITGMSYVITIVGGVLPTVSLTACSVAWTTGLSPSCSGTQTTLVSGVGAGTYPVTTALPASPGSEMFLQASAGGVLTSFTVATTVSSASPRQIRAASVTNA